MSEEQGHTPLENREGFEARFRGERGERGEPGQRGEGMTRGALHAVVFLFVLAFLLAAGSYWLSTSAVHSAVSSRASVVQLCQLGNESRTQQITLWTRLVAIAQPPPHETPAARAKRLATVREFLAYVHKLFAPRNCTKRLSG